MAEKSCVSYPIVAIELMLVKSTNGSGRMVNIGSQDKNLQRNATATDIDIILEIDDWSKARLSEKFLHVPDVVRDASLHGGRDSQ